MRPLRSVPVHAPALLPLALLLACGGDGTGPDPDPDPSIALSAAPATVSVEQGGTGSTTVSLVRGGGFTGPVTVAPSGLPSGVTASPVTLPGGATTGDMTFTAAADATPGTADVTLTGTGSGVSATTTVEIEVTEAPSGDFQLALDPQAVTLDEVAAPATAGAETGAAAAPDATVTVTITREDPFDGPVELTVTDAPANLEAGLGETTVSGTETTLTVEATAGLAPGAYTVTVTGTADGVDDRSVELDVTVESSNGGGGALSVEVCDAEWFAVKDGGDPWTRVTGAGDEYTFDASADGVGLAWVTRTSLSGGLGDIVSVEIHLLGREEIPFFQTPCETVTGGKTVTGTVSGFGGADLATVQLGFVSASVTPGMPTFTLTDVPDGELDLVVTRVLQDAGTGDVQTDRMIFRRDQDLPDGTDLELDLDGSGAFAPVDVDVMLDGLSGGDHIFSASFPSFGVGFGGTLTTRTNPGSPLTIPAVPATERQAGELHALLLAEERRGVYQFHEDPSGETVELGPPLDPVTVTSTTTATAALPSATFTPQAAYDDWWSATFSQLIGFSGIDVDVFATAAYMNGGPPVLDVPDFGAVDGWDDAWNLVPGTEITWEVSAANGLFEFASPTDGTILFFGSAEGTIDP